MEKDELELCKIMRTKCTTILENADGNLDSIKGIKKNLYQLINSLQKFENTPFADYTYLPVMLPLNMALDMLKAKDGTVDLEEIYEYFYDFMKGFNLCVQNSNRSDRQFTQTPEFNIRLYDIPTKMYAFYYAYVYNLREYLNVMSTNKPKHEYEFLICQGITNSLRVKECFKKMAKKNGLFIIEIPERAAFEPQMMLLTLTHELGHVVGTDIRQRAGRAKALEEIACKVVCEYAKIKWKSIHKEIEDPIMIEEEYWHELELYLHQKVFEDSDLEDFATNVFRYTQNEDLAERIRERDNYGFFVIQKILFRMTPYIQENKEEIYGYLVTKQYIDWLDKEPLSAKEKADELQDGLIEILGDMERYNEWNKDTFSLKEVLYIALNLMRECLADLICIMTLQLSMQKYLEAIVVNLEQLGNDQFDGTEILLRSALVTRCMLDASANPEYHFRWNNDSLKNITEPLETRLKEKIMQTIQVYLPMEQENLKYDEQERTVTSAMGMLYTPDILERIAIYLKECKEKYISYCVQSKMENKRQQLQDVYDMFGKEHEISVQHIVIEQQEYIENYLYDLKEKIRKIERVADESR